VILTLTVFAGMTTLSFLVTTHPWLKLMFVFLVCLAVVAVVEVACRRVTLTTQALVAVSNFQSRRIPRADIAKVTWEKGAGVSLKLTNGQWFHVPDLGGGSESLTNSIRAWLKRPDADA
jgi:hypothetical protein